MHARHFDLRHVAARAVTRRHGTRRTRMIGHLLACLCHVARQALRIVARRLRHQRLMRIVTRITRQPHIAAPPTLAALQSIRLKSHIRHASNLRLQNIRPSPMARPAKIHRRHRTQFPRIQNRSSTFLNFSRFHRRDMLRARPMTLLASNSRRRVRRIKSPRDHRPARVTPKTMLRLAAVHPPTKRRFNRTRRIARMPCSQRKRLQRPVKADAALVVHTIARINVRLPLMRDPKRPFQLRETEILLRLVRNRIRTPRRISRNLVAIRRQLAAQFLMTAQNLRIRSPRPRVRHRRSRLRRRLVGVTLRAFRVANQPRPIGHIFRRPPSRRSDAIFRSLRNFGFARLARLAQQAPGECEAQAEKKQPTRRA